MKNEAIQGSEMKNKSALILFTAGSSEKNEQYKKTLRDMLKKELGDAFSLKHIDIIDNPGLAEKYKILAVPTLMKIAPEPVVKIIGDLLDEAVLEKLN